MQRYWKSDFVAELTDDAIEVHMEHGPKVPSVHTAVHLYLVNGAVHDVGVDAIARSCRVEGAEGAASVGPGLLDGLGAPGDGAHFGALLDEHGRVGPEARTREGDEGVVGQLRARRPGDERLQLRVHHVRARVGVTSTVVG